METDHAWGGGIGLGGAGTGVLGEDQGQGCGEECEGLEELHFLYCGVWVERSRENKEGGLGCDIVGKWN